MSRFHLVLLTVLTLFSCTVYAKHAESASEDAPLIFATFPIPLMVESKTEGVFIELTNELIKRLGVSARIRVSPPQRSINDLVKGRVDALFPALDAFFVPDDVYTKSEELIYIKEDFVFTRKGDRMLTNIEDLEGRVVGVTRGYPYAPEIIRSNKFKLDYSLTDEICVQKLIIGRIEAFIVEEKTGIRAFEKQGVKNLMQYNSKTPISKQDVYYATGRNGKGRHLAESISDALGSMKKDGTFEKILRKAEKGLPERISKNEKAR